MKKGVQGKRSGEGRHFVMPLKRFVHRGYYSTIALMLLRRELCVVPRYQVFSQNCHHMGLLHCCQPPVRDSWLMSRTAEASPLSGKKQHVVSKCSDALHGAQAGTYVWVLGFGFGFGSWRPCLCAAGCSSPNESGHQKHI